MHRRKGYRVRSLGKRALQPETLMMSYGYDPMLSEGALKCPIFQTSTFVFQSAEDGRDFFELAYGKRREHPGEETGLIYTRINNPDLQILEERLCVWDDAESGLVFASGMSAITTTLLSFLRPGDVIVHSEPVYGGSDYLIRQILPRFGVHPEGFAAGDSGGLERALQRAEGKGRLRVLFIETPANPTNDLVDIEECAKRAASLARPGDDRPLLVVDNTFLGPLWQAPLRHGADLVLYSLTKYVSGHSDLIAGACLGAEELIDQIRAVRTIFGTIADPWTCWLVLRSLETVKLRMTGATENARRVAEYLVGHPKVARVLYLGFIDDGCPQQAIYQRQCSGPGSTFSFEVAGGEPAAYRVLNELRIIKLAVSLGGTESLAEHPASMTHSDVPAEAQRRVGITEGLIRVSIGIEHPDDLIADLEQALRAA